MARSASSHGILQEASANLPARLRKALVDLEKFRPNLVRGTCFQHRLDWSFEGVRLGFGTLLAKRILGSEARVLSLLSFSFEKSFPASTLHELRLLEAKALSGNLSKADVAEMSSAVVPPLLALNSARRLHMAAALLDAEFLLPDELMEIAGLDSIHLRSISKYSPDQPRVPSGQTRGGEWTQGDGNENSKPGTDSAAERNPLSNKEALAGTLQGRTVDHKAGITHCTYSTPLGNFTIEYLFVTKCDSTFPVPF